MPLQKLGIGEQECLDIILSIVHMRTGIDFSHYRRDTVQRRLQNRMVCMGIKSFAEYLHHLETCQDETQALIERLTIKVSTFFRNPKAFERLRLELELRFALRPANQPIQVWCVGCGRGEEAYSLSFLLEEMGLNYCITATDIDKGALDFARQAIYPVEAISSIPDIYKARYFYSETGIPQVCTLARPGLQNRIRFLYHDLTSPLPPSNNLPFDLISCRNLLIYLKSKYQRHAWANLMSQVHRGSLIFLGEAEWPLPKWLDRLAVLDHRQRLFRVSNINEVCE